jgi:dTDP-4-amino-4,6-dideoxygalactose transaminase
LGLPAGSAALLPAFVCDTVSKPLRMAGARLVYYRVGGDLAPDLEHAAQLLGRDAGIRALLWYHYLGFDRDAFRARLALHGVEAATHWPDWLLPAPHGLEFADAWRLSDTLLTLPCHQDLCEEHIDYAARMVQRCWRR